MSREWNSLDELDLEIARLQNLLKRPNYRFPNLTTMQIFLYRRQRLQFTWPIIWKLRTWLENTLDNLARWIGP